MVYIFPVVHFLQATQQEDSRSIQQQSNSSRTVFPLKNLESFMIKPFYSRGLDKQAFTMTVNYLEWVFTICHSNDRDSCQIYFLIETNLLICPPNPCKSFFSKLSLFLIGCVEFSDWSKKAMPSPAMKKRKKKKKGMTCTYLNKRMKLYPQQKLADLIKI